MLKFKEFIKEFNLKNKATSNIKIKKVLDKLGLKFPLIECGIYMRDDNFTTSVGIVNLHPYKGTHWVLYINRFYFDSYGILPPLSIQKYIKSKYKTLIYSEYKIQNNNNKVQDSLCAAYCLYIIYLCEIIGLPFQNAVLKLYYSVLEPQRAYGDHSSR